MQRRVVLAIAAVWTEAVKWLKSSADGEGGL